MKKILLFSAFILAAAGVFANDPSEVSEKVLKAFRETFTEARQVSWQESDDNYAVRFMQKDVRYIVYYNKEGIITHSMRFYQPGLLPVNILKEIKNSYKNKAPYGVTEITNDGEVAYFVKMEDAKYWYTVKFSAYGNSELYEKFKKQQ